MKTIPFSRLFASAVALYVILVVGACSDDPPATNGEGDDDDNMGGASTGGGSGRCEAGQTACAGDALVVCGPGGEEFDPLVVCEEACIEKDGMAACRNASGSGGTGGLENTGGDAGTGGNDDSGGSSNTGGLGNTGGDANTGGNVSTGGDPGTGGNSAGGTSTGGSDSGSESCDEPSVLDDLEDADLNVCLNEGRDGSWSFQWGSQLTPEPVQVSFGDSTKALLLSTSNASSDDLVMRARLRSTADGTGYDLSGYEGITFYARGWQKGAPNTPLPLSVQVETAQNLSAPEGACTAGCDDHYSYSLGNLGEYRKRYFVPLYGAFQSGNGTARNLDLENVVALSFISPRDSTQGQYLMIDDVRFVEWDHIGDRPSSDRKGRVEDTMALISDSEPGYETTTNGATEVLGPLNEKDVYLRFDLSGYDAAATVTSAIVRVTQVSDAGPISGVARVVQDWDADTMTGESRPAAADFTLAPNFRIAETSEVRIAIPNEIVEFWLRNPELNYGLRLQGGANTIASSDLSTVQEARPELIVSLGEPLSPTVSQGCDSPAVIDDMEDGDERVCLTDGRDGHYFYTPYQSGEIESEPIVPRVEVLNPPRGNSDRGIHVNLENNSLGIRLVDQGTYDASSFQGIEFFVRREGGDTNQPLMVRFQQRSTLPESRGGTCVATCDAHYETALPPPTNGWERRVVLFEGMSQPFWVYEEHGPITPEQGVAFTFSRGGDEFWIDDVRFVQAQNYAAGTTRDATIYLEDLGGGQDTTNYGSESDLAVALDPEGSIFSDNDIRSLLAFDLSGLPSGVKVLGAALRLQQNCESGNCPVQDGTNYSIRVRRNSEDWDEDTVTGATAPGLASQGLLASVFRSRYNTNYGVMLEPSVVQGWIDNPSENYGVTIEGDLGVRFHSSESPSTSKRPRLLLVLQ